MTGRHSVRAVMLDVDGVLVCGRPQDRRRWDAELEAHLGLSPKLLHEAFFAPHWRTIVEGKAGLAEVLSPVLARIAPHLSAAVLTDYWFRHDACVDRALLRQVSALRASGLTLCLATNQDHARAEYLWRDLRLSHHFAAMFHSAAIGAAKPARAFFTAIEAATGWRAGELILVDDSPANTAAARSAGWHAHDWRQGDDLVAIVQGVGGCRDGGG